MLSGAIYDMGLNIASKWKIILFKSPKIGGGTLYFISKSPNSFKWELSIS